MIQYLLQYSNCLLQLLVVNHTIPKSQKSNRKTNNLIKIMNDVIQSLYIQYLLTNRQKTKLIFILYGRNQFCSQYSNSSTRFFAQKTQKSFQYTTDTQFDQIQKVTPYTIFSYQLQYILIKNQSQRQLIQDQIKREPTTKTDGQLLEIRSIKIKQYFKRKYQQQNKKNGKKQKEYHIHIKEFNSLTIKSGKIKNRKLQNLFHADFFSAFLTILTILIINIKQQIIILTQIFNCLQYMTNSKQYTNIQSLRWYEKVLNKSNSLTKDRQIIALIQDQHLPLNKINTSKYNYWNFVPKNLMEQFRKLPNLYFLLIGVLQILPYTTSTTGVPSIYIPLGIIVLVTAIRDLYEDYKRAVSDQNQNNQQIFYLKDKKFILRKSDQIRVGSVIKIMRNEMIPCDGLILYSPSDYAFVQTKNLDGETNLKRKNLIRQLKEKLNNIEQEGDFPTIQVNYQKPNTNMNHFQGKLKIQEKQIPLNNSNICLRSSRLANTQFIYLLALYTGHDTKILLSMNTPIQKKSTLQQKLGYLILSIFIFLLVISIVISGLKLQMNKTSILSSENQSIIKIYIITVFSWILNLTNLVPISLIVTLQSVKLLEGKLIENDVEMENQNFHTMVNCSNVIEDLGVIQYVASDKTGTLTKNNLKMVEISDSRHSYNEKSNDIPKQMLKFLAICHQVYISQKGQFEGLSNDQVCILKFCKSAQTHMVFRDQYKLQIKQENQLIDISILKIIEFSSERKKHSVIFKEKDQIYIITKGADLEMKQRINKCSNSVKIFKNVDRMASNGLRTLVYGYSSLNEEYFDKWNRKYQLAKLQNNQKQLSLLEFQIENHLAGLCGIGIQDQLQQQVAETIKCILKADIKFMIISGDKAETVLSIAKNLHIQQDEPYLAPVNQFREEYYEKKFIVFARCSPREKQRIVSAIKGKVLAIGDGANDVSMITKATIGVGVDGKEGKAAIQCADFGIPSFRYLRRLIFYYGGQAYRKNSILIKYNFYKNFVYSLPQLIFGIYSGFSGVAIYDTYVSQLFNLLFTTLPIIMFALFDQNIPGKELEMNQQNHYAQSKNRICFSNKEIFFSLLEATLQTLLASFICFNFLPKFFVSPNDLNLYQSSSVLLLYVVLITNINIMLQAQKLSIGFAFSIILSIASFFVSMKIFCSISYNLLNSYNKIFSQKSLIIILLCLIFSFLITLFLRFIKNWNLFIGRENPNNKIVVQSISTLKLKHPFQISS